MSWAWLIAFGPIVLSQAAAYPKHVKDNPPPDNQEKTITQSNEDEEAQAAGKDDVADKGDVIGTQG